LIDDVYDGFAAYYPTFSNDYNGAVLQIVGSDSFVGGVLQGGGGHGP
jgi:hypothetical protein